jgi:hypothetical protein
MQPEIDFDFSDSAADKDENKAVGSLPPGRLASEIGKARLAPTATDAVGTGRAAPAATAPPAAPTRPPRAEATPERVSLAAWAVAAGLLIGYVGSAFFTNVLMGLSFPLFIALLVVVAAATARRAGVALRPHNLWLALPALFFAFMLAVRADPTMRDMNIVLSLALGALWLYFLPKRERLDEATVSEYAAGVIETSARSLIAPGAEFDYAREWLRNRSDGRSRTMTAVVRGLLLAAPILIVFAVLLSTADAVFSRALRDLGSLFSLSDTSILYRAFWLAVFGWFGVGVAACAMLGTRHTTPAPSADADAIAAALNKRTAARKRTPITLSMIETSIVLLGVNLMFAVFVLIQFRYFFGGHANVTVQGLTYAEYARRGFFELVAVAVLTLGLVLALDWVTVRSGSGQHRLFRGLALVLTALVGVMMFSAYSRMELYQDAYGYTPLRVSVSIFIPWLAVVFGFFVLTLFRVRERIFSLGVLLCAIGFAVHLNVMNVEGTIAQRNIDRYQAGEALDGDLLVTFSVDAFAPIWALYQDESAPEEVRAFAESWLYNRYVSLQSARQSVGGTLLSANWARDTAYAQLSDIALSTDPYSGGLWSRESWYFEGRER